MLYLDSSAFVKLVVQEPELKVLQTYLAADERLISSRLLYVETVRAAARHGPDSAALARTLLSGLTFMDIDEGILRAAAEVGSLALRTLDAIHIATALTLGDELNALVTYDRRMQEAATVLGMEFAAPA